MFTAVTAPFLLYRALHFLNRHRLEGRPAGTIGVYDVMDPARRSVLVFLFLKASVFLFLLWTGKRKRSRSVTSWTPMAPDGPL